VWYNTCGGEKMDTKRADINNRSLWTGDIVVIKYEDKCSNRFFCDVGIIQYNIVNCQFYILCKYGVQVEFADVGYIKIIDRMCNHNDKTVQDVLELYKDEWKKYE
jgi:hypothetical protein